MRNILPFFLFFPILLNAQNIPNAGFEDWYIGDVVLEADHWRSSNSYTFNQYLVYSANPDWVYYSEGITSARLTTVVLDTLGPYAGRIVSGAPMMDYETFELDIISGGTPFPYRPEKLTGQYRYQSESPIEDFGQAHVILKKYNPATGKRDTIGIGENVLLNPSSDFKTFEVPIQYLVADVIPDSVIVFFYSSHPQAPVAGSELWVDDLSFGDFTASAAVISPEISASLYPNPFRDFLNVEITAPEAGVIELLSAEGRPIATRKVEPGFQTIKMETGNLPAGNYFIAWQRSNGEKVVLKKVVKL